MGWFGAKSQMERLGLAAGAVGPVKQQRARLVVSREVWRVCELLSIKGCLVRVLNEESGAAVTGHSRSGTGLRGVSRGSALSFLLSTRSLLFIFIPALGSNSVLGWVSSSAAGCWVVSYLSGF